MMLKKIKSLINSIHPEVNEKFYGCGLIIPEAIEGSHILDLGSGSGRDSFILASLAGKTGRVVGIDMTKEQIEVANRLIREIGFTSELIDAESPVGNLSGGERQGVAIARAIYNEAELIVLDEPTNNLSLNETQKVFDFIANVKETGRSVLFIGHNIYHVYDISDRFVILDRGEVIHKLDKKEVASAEDLMKIMRDTIKGH